MRIVHLADLHIGVENYGRNDPDTGLSTRLGDFLSAFDEVVDFALQHEADLVLLAGDVYKGRDPSQTHQREFARRLTRLSNAGIPTFILVGNHDLPNAPSRANAVEIFPTLEVPNVHIASQLRTHNIETRAGPVQIIAVPWPRRSGILSRTESRELTIDQVRQEIESRLTTAINQQLESLDPDIPAVLTAHATVNGATVGTERSMMLGDDHTLLVSTLHRPELEYVALGHIHQHQVLRHDPPMVVYAGSLQRVDFSEEKDQKGFCAFDLDPAAPQGRRMTGWSFHPVAARPFVTIDATIKPNDPDPTTSVLQAISRHPIDGAVVRVRITLPPGTDGQLRDQDIHQALQDAHYVAAITRETQETRRTRLEPDATQGLAPMQALRLYLETRDIEPERLEEIVLYARTIETEVQQVRGE